MSEGSFLYGDKEDTNGKESYLPTSLRPRSASKGQRSKMMAENGSPSTDLSEADHHIEDFSMNGTALLKKDDITVDQVPAAVEMIKVNGDESKTPSAVLIPAELIEQVNHQKETDSVPQLNGISSKVESSKAANEKVMEEPLKPLQKDAQETTAEEVPASKEIAEEKAQDSDVDVADKDKIDKGKAPEKPKVEMYTLPIGGGPKKNIVLPPIRTYTKPKEAVVVASTTRSRYNTTGSRKSNNMRKKGVNLASIQRKSASKASLTTQEKDGKPIVKRSASAPEQGNKDAALSAEKVKPKPRKSKGKGKPRLVYPERKDVATTVKRSANGQVQQRRRVKRRPGQVNATKKTQLGTEAESTEGNDKKAASSATQVDDQKPLSSQADGVKADNHSEMSAEGDDASFTTAMEEEELDSFDIEIAPVKIYEDDDGVKEVEDAPLGSYATLPPSKARLEKASELTLYDEDGNLVQFGSIFANRRTLICFLRHWLCPFCQMFAKSIQAIDPLPLESANMSLVVIGQGHWHVTKSYKEVMRIPNFVRMYADPSRKVYKMLGMTFRTNDQGPACDRPEYQTMGVFKASMIAMKKGIFDMPLRVPGDLMLLGGEFILGPGPQCSFTHRMETTRGHLDLPKILTQAGCDMSLKSAPGLLEEHNNRPSSTRSFDRKTSRLFTRRMKGKERSSAELGSRKSDSIGKMKTNNDASTLNGDEIQHERKTSSTYTKRKPPPPLPLPNVRNLNISYPIKKQQQIELSPCYSDFEDDNMIQITRDFVDRADSDLDHTLPSPYSPTSPTWNNHLSTKPLGMVKERESDGMKSELAKLPFTSGYDPLPSPPLPTTSSAAAYVAATARARAIQRKDQESMMAARKSLGKIYTSRKANESMPTLSNGDVSSPMSPLMQAVHSSSSEKNNSNRQTVDSTYTEMTHRPGGDAEMSPPNSADPSLLDFLGASQDKTVDTSVESDLETISATNPLTRSGSSKRQGFVSPAGVPMSVFEKLANVGSPKRSTFSSSSPSLPLGDSTFVDASSTPFKTPITPRSEDGFGEDTEYKRLDRKALERPSLDDLKRQKKTLQNQRSGTLRSMPSKEHLNKPLPPLLASLEVNNELQNEQKSVGEDEDLQRTPKARTLSLEPENVKGRKETSNQAIGNYSPSQEIASSSSSAAHVPNRSSIIAAPTLSSYYTMAPKATPSGVKTSSSAAAAAFSNPLFASLPPMPPPTMPPPPVPSMPVSSRAPMPATNPLFASVLAEEAARKDNSAPPSMKIAKAPASALSEWKQFKQSPNNAVKSDVSSVASIKKKAAGKTFGSSSFLDDLDVHDNLQSSNKSLDLRYSPSVGVSESAASDYGNEEETEEEDDDWAPLQASKNVIPAGISEQDTDEKTDFSISDLSTEEEDFEDDDEELSPTAQRYRGFMPSPIDRSQKNYVLQKVTSRPSSTSSSRPRKVELKTSSRRLYQPPNLNAFNEEEEDQYTPKKKSINQDMIHAH